MIARTTLDGLKNRRLAAMCEAGRAEFGGVYDATRLVLDVGELVRDARGQAGLSQQNLAEKIGISGAAIGRLEAGGVDVTLTVLHRVAAAHGRRVTVELSEVN